MAGMLTTACTGNVAVAAAPPRAAARRTARASASVRSLSSTTRRAIKSQASSTSGSARAVATCAPRPSRARRTDRAVSLVVRADAFGNLTERLNGVGRPQG